ncbi:MAG: LPS assembly lipoprotein LptE [Thauera sp.]|jgi:LPS-assembly lipoprotein|nr:LPS assembly lipoprotein LptE [Thauera sp.]
MPAAFQALRAALHPASQGAPRRQRRLLIGALAASLLISGCGFQLRGNQALNFASVHLNMPASSPLGSKLRQLISANSSTRIVEDPAAAEVRLQILANERGREILSLTGAGKVREYQLSQHLRYQLLDTAGNSLLDPATLSATREYTFDDSLILGKEQEEELLYRDMEEDLLQQLLRRLARFQRQP